MCFRIDSSLGKKERAAVYRIKRGPQSPARVVKAPCGPPPPCEPGEVGGSGNPETFTFAARGHTTLPARARCILFHYLSQTPGSAEPMNYSQTPRCWTTHPRVQHRPSVDVTNRATELMRAQPWHRDPLYSPPSRPAWCPARATTLTLSCIRARASHLWLPEAFSAVSMGTLSCMRARARVLAHRTYGYGLSHA